MGETVMNDRIEVLAKGLPDFRGEAWLVKDRPTGHCFIVSGVHAYVSGWEVLVFAAEGDGTVVNFGEVVGGRGITHADAIEQLAEHLAGPPSEWSAEECPHCNEPRATGEPTEQGSDG